MNKIYVHIKLLLRTDLFQKTSISDYFLDQEIQQEHQINDLLNINVS